MALSMDNLERAFERAQSLGYLFFAVVIENEGLECPETIINPRQNFDKKFMYYREHYAHNLEMKGNPAIRIVGWGMGDNYREVALSVWGKYYE